MGRGYDDCHGSGQHEHVADRKLETPGPEFPTPCSGEKEIIFKKPSGKVVTQTAAFGTAGGSAGEDGKIKYTSVSGDLDEVGYWEMQAKVILPTGTFKSEIEGFRRWWSSGNRPARDATRINDRQSLKPLFQAPNKPVRSHVYSEIGAARSIKTKNYSYIALRYTKEQVQGVREENRRYLRGMTGLSGSVSRSIATHPLAYTGDQLYDLKRDPDAQKNLEGYPNHARTLKQLKQTLAIELKKFPGRPYGEFVLGGNAVTGGGYEEVFKSLRKAAGVKKKKK